MRCLDDDAIKREEFKRHEQIQQTTLINLKRMTTTHKTSTLDKEKEKDLKKQSTSEYKYELEPYYAHSTKSINCFPDQILGRERPGQIPGLQGRSSERPKRQAVGLPEGDARVGQPVFLAKLLHKRRNLPEVASGQPRKQMVLDLELQPPVEPIHPMRT
ncbi:unnamed protein product [Cuscuta europaea]|uniref:Uncharacterized protein n=1 Tax=Cuscuta europaea TaxID=41803 RepID=A0A9P0YSX4_CUSEU|nr:unnamed protein product [Cuscuta europaea]